MSSTINRRQLLRSGFLAAGAFSVIPAYPWHGLSTRALPVDTKGRVIHSPFLREYTLPMNRHLTKPAVRLHSNENPYGPSPKAVEAIRAHASRGNRYAWDTEDEFRQILAEKEGVSPDQILITPGSTQILQDAAIFFFREGGNIVSADPTFMTILRVAQQAGATWKAIPLAGDWSHDLGAMEKATDANTRLIYVCNPNNPTGSMTPVEPLMDFCDRMSDKVPVFVDEAYYEFLPVGSQPSAVELIRKGKDLIVARTFSKIHGMAGLRVGYAIGQPDTLDTIRDYVVQGMGVSITSMMGAMASLKDTEFQDMAREKNQDARKYTINSLTSRGYSPVDSYTSFVLFPIPVSGKTYLEKMNELGVGVRSLAIDEQDYCRVSIGTMDEMHTFIDAVDKVLS